MWRWYFYWDSKFRKGKSRGRGKLCQVNKPWRIEHKYNGCLFHVLWSLNGTFEILSNSAKNTLSTGTGALVYRFDIHLLSFGQPSGYSCVPQTLYKKAQSKDFDGKFLFLQSLTSLFIGTWFPFAQNFSSTFIWHNWGVYNLGMSKRCQHISDKQENSCYRKLENACI